MSISEKIEDELGADLIVDYNDVFYWIDSYSIESNWIKLATSDNAMDEFKLNDVLRKGAFYKFEKLSDEVENWRSK